MKKHILLIFLLLQLVSLINGQEGTVTNPPGAEIVREEERRASRGNPVPFFRDNKRDKEKKEFEKVLKHSEKILLKPSDEDVEANSLFLKSPKSYLVKIFSDVECDPKVVDTNDFKCLQAARMTGRGAYYSFRKNSHIDSSKFDIYFSNGEFSIIKSPSLVGYFQDLGNVSIDLIQNNSKQLNALRQHNIPQTKSEVLIEQQKLVNGFEIGKEQVSSKFKIKTNSAFALRLVSYEKRVSSLLIVGRLIRENEDGSISLLWREIDRNKSIGR